MPTPEHPICSVLGIPIATGGADTTMDVLIAGAVANARLLVTYCNVHTANLAYSDPDFRKLLAEWADRVFCDGFGITVATTLTGQEKPERHTPPDWIVPFASRSAELGLSWFLLGSSEESVTVAASKIAQASGVTIAGIHHGHFDHTDPEATGEVIRRINAAGASVLIVGMGQPKQEKWLKANWQTLHVPVALCVGAMFDYVSATLPRAPAWITGSGLEWAARLAREPKRMWRRYLVGLPLFLVRAIRYNEPDPQGRSDHPGSPSA